MIEQVQARLETLKDEFSAGEEKLSELMRQEAGLRETLLRISGAIQVLQEVLDSPTPDAGSPAQAEPVGAPTNGTAAPSGTVLHVP